MDVEWQTAERYRRLGRLMMLLMRSGETKRLLEGSSHTFTTTDLAGIKSVAYLRNVGKSDMKGAEIVSQKRLPGGKWEIYYLSPFRDDTWEDTLRAWVERPNAKLAA
jgi:hypothetical protein